MKSKILNLLIITVIYIKASSQFIGRADYILTIKNEYRTHKNFLELKQNYKLIPKYYYMIHGFMPVRCPTDMSRNTIKRLLESDYRISRVEPDYRIDAIGIPNDPFFKKQWSLYNSTNQDKDVNAVKAWGLHKGSNKIIIAIIDTGIDYLHPDLFSNMWRNPGEIPGNKRDDDRNGFVDDIYGWSFDEGNADPIDRHYHGTHVAGIVGAVGNNNIGITGIMNKVSLMAVKGLGDFGFGWASNLIAGIYYAVDNGAKVINASWGGTGKLEAMKDAILYAKSKDVIFVAACGNNNRDNDIWPFYPASYEVSNVVSVAATDKNDNLAWFSNWGKNSVDIAAPGVDILSTVLKDNYNTETGTSMAAPHVTGTLGLMISFIPYLTTKEYLKVLYSSVNPMPILKDKCTSGGRLDIYKCLYTMIPNVKKYQTALLYLLEQEERNKK